jgi:hypothetical protein
MRHANYYVKVVVFWANNSPLIEYYYNDMRQAGMDDDKSVVCATNLAFPIKKMSFVVVLPKVYTRKCITLR